MRFANALVGVVGLGLAAAGAAACSSTSNGAATAASGVGTGGGGVAGGTGTGGGGSSAASCSPSAACTAVDKTCLGLVDNQGKTKFGLRMSELDLTAPQSLSSGLFKTTVAGSVAPNDAACNLMGPALFSWLLQFDTTAGTLKTGGAKPVTDAAQGYSFDDEMLNGVHVQPITMTNVTPDASGQFSVAQGQDLVLPIFLDATGASAIVLPLHQARIRMGTLSSNDNCIGQYNAAGLDPLNSCQPDSTHSQFITGGSVDGYITLEDADAILITALNESLCVVLAGDPTTYGTTSPDSGATICKRDTNKTIVYQGAWCSTTNMAATATCADAEPFAGDFAASSVLINN